MAGGGFRGAVLLYSAGFAIGRTQFAVGYAPEQSVLLVGYSRRKVVRCRKEKRARVLVATVEESGFVYYTTLPRYLYCWLQLDCCFTRGKVDKQV